MPAAPSQLSAQWFDHAKSFAGEDALFAAGFGVLTDYLARDLTIKLEQQVTAIHCTTTGVQVHNN